MAEIDELDGDFDFIKDGDRVRSTVSWQDVFNGDHPELVPMQYTGLTDKNGKEIYEGDIILHTRQKSPYSKKPKKAIVACIVEWDNGQNADKELNPVLSDNPSMFNTNPGFIARPVDSKAETSRWGYDWSEFHDCEVIGNIYENPELIKP